MIASVKTCPSGFREMGRKLLHGVCADCGHGQRVTPIQQELPCAPRCESCGGPVQTGLSGSCAKKQPGSWRCPGCGGMFDRSDLHWAIPMHLSTNVECVDVLLDKDRFVRHEGTWYLPETAHLKRGKDGKWRITAIHPEGKDVILGEWSIADKALAVKRLREIYPESAQLRGKKL